MNTITPKTLAAMTVKTVNTSTKAKNDQVKGSHQMQILCQVNLRLVVTKAKAKLVQSICHSDSTQFFFVLEMDVVLKKSKQKNKKYAVVVDKKTINFGAEGYEDYTTHKDSSRKDRYVKRHKDSENWNKSGIETPGFWAKHILWN